MTGRTAEKTKATMIYEGESEVNRWIQWVENALFPECLAFSITPAIATSTFILQHEVGGLAERIEHHAELWPTGIQGCIMGLLW
jgi:hypothetical protein